MNPSNFSDLGNFPTSSNTVCSFHSAVAARRESAGDSNNVSYQLSPRKKELTASVFAKASLLMDLTKENGFL